MKPYAKLLVLTLLVILLAACGGKTEPTPTKTPRPSATPTPLPTLAALLPAVESNHAPASEPTSPPSAPTEPASPLATPTPSPAPTPVPTPTPGIEAQPPVPVLAANLSCGDGCVAGDPDGVGLVVLNRETGQLNVWVAEMEELGDDQEYEGWLVEGGTMQSAIRFGVDEDGRGAPFTAVPDLKDGSWSAFTLTIEPEPDDSEAPSDARTIGGTLRTTAMGEALYSRFDMPCQRCHGATAEGNGDAPPLTGMSLPYEAFSAAVRGHDQPITSDVVADRDLRHMYAWLITTLR